MLARRIKITHPNGSTCETPLLVPSFSSKGFGYFHPLEDEIPRRKRGRTKRVRRLSIASLFLDLVAPSISEALLISAYDLHFGLFQDAERHLKEKSLVFLDSGGYELAPEYDSSEPKHFEYKPRRGFRAKQYRSVLDALDPTLPYVMANFDWATRAKPIPAQIKAAQKLYNAFPGWLPNFLIKPGCAHEGKRVDRIDTNRFVRPSLASMHPFRILGVTERELGPKLVDRLTTIAELRTAMDDAGYQQTPIHIWGGLDPILTPLYFFAGANVFDGVSWLRYAFHDGLAVSWDAGMVLRGLLSESRMEADARTAGANLVQMRVLTSAMKMFVASGGVDFSGFGGREAVFKKAYSEMVTEIPALAKSVTKREV